jgi:Ni/Fe-hydrogenase 1 B-type cytochrome subunit
MEHLVKEIIMIKKHYEFSLSLRLTHWIRVLAIIILTFTGFYIAVPFIAPALNMDEPNNYLYALMRSWHIIFGFLLIAATIGKFYLFIFDKQSKVERASFWDFISPKMWFKQIKYYLLIGSHVPLKGVYNPLQFMAYTGIFVALLVICITGLILHINVYHEGLGGLLYEVLKPLEVILGGLAVVREIHHICMWVFLIFLPIHIYLVIFNSVYGKSGDMDSIISGYKWKEEKE